MIVVREDVIFSFLLFFWQQDIYVLLFFDFPLYNGSLSTVVGR